MDSYEALQNRLTHTYSEEVEYWRSLCADDLIDLAEVIAAKKSIYSELMDDDIPENVSDYLLQFKRPLEILTHKMVEHAYQGGARLQLGNILEHLVKMPIDTHGADYELESGFQGPQSQQMG